MTPPPKLLYLVSEDWYFVSHRLALACAAADAGYDVCVAARVDQHGDAIKKAGLRLIPIGFERAGLGPLPEAKTLASLVQLYRRERPGIVHHVAIKPVIYGSIAAHAAGVPSIVNALMGLGFVFSSDTPKAKLLRPLVRAGLRRALRTTSSRTIVQNRDDRDLLLRERLADADTIRLIHGSGVDPAAFDTSPPPPGVPIIVLPARFLADKGIREFTAAAAILKAAGTAARFVLVGATDPQNPASLSKAEIEGFVQSGLVEDWGWRPDMPDVMRQASIVCLPSYREGLPKVLLEAAAAARPIVAADVPGCREIVRPGVNGWLVPPRDPPELAAALVEALADPERCRAYGLQGRKIVEDEFSLKAVISETLRVYRELLATRNEA